MKNNMDELTVLGDLLGLLEGDFEGDELGLFDGDELGLFEGVLKVIEM